MNRTSIDSKINNYFEKYSHVFALITDLIRTFLEKDIFKTFVICNTVKPALSRHSRGNLHCSFNRGVRLKEVLVPRPPTRYDLKENSIVYFIDYPVI